MNSFKSYLEEGRDSPLYHGTYITSAIRIIDDNELRKGGANYAHVFTKDNKHISLTRNLAFAKNWSREGVVFEFDQRRLAQRYKIIPFNYFTNASIADKSGQGLQFNKTRNPGILKSKYSGIVNQFEEIVTKDIKNVSSFITKIHLHEKYYFDMKFDSLVSRFNEAGKVVPWS